MATKLTELVTSCGGCAAKWDGAALEGMLETMTNRPDGRSNLIVGLAPFDDAAVLDWSSDEVLVSTLDFFPAVVDDPCDFGGIATANACSDVFAMGGRVLVGLAIAAFPLEIEDDDVLQIMTAATETLQQAGGELGGGHTIRAAEPIFGMAVQGAVRRDRIWRKSGARPGQAVMLSKPLGTGLVLNGGTDAQKRKAIDSMRTTNRAAADHLQALATGPSAVTDVTGFGLLGHSWEIASRSEVRVHLDATALPVYDGAHDAIAAGKHTSGDVRNRRYVDGHVTLPEDPISCALGFDPQTSGGLLAVVDVAEAATLRDQGFWEIGRTEAGLPGVVLEA